jgi:hypothetical protein
MQISRPYKNPRNLFDAENVLQLEVYSTCLDAVTVCHFSSTGNELQVKLHDCRRRLRENKLCQLMANLERYKYVHRGRLTVCTICEILVTSGS